jgi:ABC-type glycerol-3-phosphate transport system permease component
MKRQGKWAWLWIAWLLALVGLEWAAVRSHHPKPRTLTEHLARWFPRRWRRALLVGLMALLTWHFWNAADVVPQMIGP